MTMDMTSIEMDDTVADVMDKITLAVLKDMVDDEFVEFKYAEAAQTLVEWFGVDGVDFNVEK
jgi:hypothetical protein